MRLGCNDPTIAELIDRLVQLRRENAELAAKNKVLRAYFAKLYAGIAAIFATKVAEMNSAITALFSDTALKCHR